MPKTAVFAIRISYDVLSTPRFWASGLGWYLHVQGLNAKARNATKKFERTRRQTQLMHFGATFADSRMLV